MVESNPIALPVTLESSFRVFLSDRTDRLTPSRCRPEQQLDQPDVAFGALGACLTHRSGLDRPGRPDVRLGAADRRPWPVDRAVGTCSFAVPGWTSVAIGPVRDALSLSGTRTVTIAQRRAKIPVTIVSDFPSPVHGVLRLESGDLTLASGQTRQAVVLARKNTSVSATVSTRTSGVSTLEVELVSPRGGIVLIDKGFTVRSTAFSIVAVIISVVALADPRRHGGSAPTPDEDAGGHANARRRRSSPGPSGERPLRRRRPPT